MPYKFNTFLCANLRQYAGYSLSNKQIRLYKLYIYESESLFYNICVQLQIVLRKSCLRYEAEHQN